MYFVDEQPDKVVLYEVVNRRYNFCWCLFLLRNLIRLPVGMFSHRYKADFSDRAFLLWLSHRVSWWTKKYIYPPGTTFEYLKRAPRIRYDRGLSFRTGTVPRHWW